jgi:alkaline phosphatase D
VQPPYQAYYEAMPLRARSLPKGPNLQLYRSASFGTLANFTVLDTRQYRTDQPNNEQPSPLNAATMDPKSSMMAARSATGSSARSSTRLRRGT